MARGSAAGPLLVADGPHEKLTRYRAVRVAVVDGVSDIGSAGSIGRMGLVAGFECHVTQGWLGTVRLRAAVLAAVDIAAVCVPLRLRVVRLKRVQRALQRG